METIAVFALVFAQGVKNQITALGVSPAYKWKQ
jgi:hypothetical protein